MAQPAEHGCNSGTLSAAQRAMSFVSSKVGDGAPRRDPCHGESRARCTLSGVITQCCMSGPMACGDTRGR